VSVADLLDRLAQGHPLDRAAGLALIDAPPEEWGRVRALAGALRDRGKGRTVTYSRKVFLPLTNLCRDDCGYCTFKRDPGQPGARTMELDEVLAVCEAGARLGCKEALLSLGDKPEARFPEHRDWLRLRGYRTTMEYVLAAARAIVQETPLLPHANPGLMSERDLHALQETNVSVGLMLETTADRLAGADGPHGRAPDKLPRRRLATLEAAGRVGIAFTTGLLVGIGETRAERVDTLLAIRGSQERYGHVQEVIVQNFRAKPTIPRADALEPDALDVARTVAVARLVLDDDVSVQAPPNLSPDDHALLIGAGLNDWGGISALSPDYVNPEAPWPHVRALAATCAAHGYVLRPRLPVYERYVGSPEWIDRALGPAVAAAAARLDVVPTFTEAYLA